MKEIKTVNKFKPILFSTPMVWAILNGKKTMTRRVIKLPKDYDGKAIFRNEPFGIKYSSNEFDGCVHRLNSKWQIGDILWVRETFENYHGGWNYKAGKYGLLGEGWKPSIFMPKEACRLFLEVTNIRAERLQDITEEDAISEGTDTLDIYTGYEVSNKGKFEGLWVNINGVESWESNPFVWVITFKIVDKPNDFL